MNRLFCLLMILSILFSCRNENANEISIEQQPAIPLSIKAEHDSLLKTANSFSVPGDTSTAAKKFLELLQHHFSEEEEYVLPALALLPVLANNQVPKDSKKYLALINKFRKNGTHISAEHQFIKLYLEELKSTPSKQNLPIAGFERLLQRHAAMEEEIYFPTILLIGKYLEANQTKN